MTVVIGRPRRRPRLRHCRRPTTTDHSQPPPTTPQTTKPSKTRHLAPFFSHIPPRKKFPANHQPLRHLRSPPARGEEMPRPLPLSPRASGGRCRRQRGVRSVDHLAGWRGRPPLQSLRDSFPPGGSADQPLLECTRPHRTPRPNSRSRDCCASVILAIGRPIIGCVAGSQSAKITTWNIDSWGELCAGGACAGPQPDPD